MLTFTPTVAQAWLLLAAAGLLEIGWALGMKSTQGFTRLWPSVAVLTVAWLSFWLLSLAMKALPVGTAYAVWVGIGAAGAALFGMLFFHEPATLPHILCVLLIVAGVIGLRLAGGE